VQTAREAGIDVEQAAAILPAALEFLKENLDFAGDDEPPPAPVQRAPRFTAAARKANHEKRWASEEKKLLASTMTRRGEITASGKQALHAGDAALLRRGPRAARIGDRRSGGHRGNTVGSATGTRTETAPAGARRRSLSG
jgi:hypothetical protein